MDFTLTPRQQALKKEFEEFFSQEEQNAPEGWLGGSGANLETDDGWAYHLRVGKKLGEKGWLSLAWPKEYGGSELGHVDQVVFNETRAYYRVPGIDQGPYFLAAAILEYGSEEMKREWLPRIANRETTWCQGFSEPNAGSDLASLTTTATEDGDDFVINGQKIWTSAAHRANHMFLIARTDQNAKKHKGLTFFITPTDRPGFTARPIYHMSGKHSYNEVFFDNFRIPKRNVVGEVNNGWYVTMAGMEFERSGISFIAETMRDLDDIVEFCKETDLGRNIISRSPTLKHKLAQRKVEVETARQFAYYIAWLQSKHELIPAEASAGKCYAAQLMVRVAHTGLEVLGLYATLKQGSKWAQLRGRFEYIIQHGLGPSLAGGTNEIQKNIIAWMGLGLPRE